MLNRLTKMADMRITQICVLIFNICLCIILLFVPVHGMKNILITEFPIFFQHGFFAKQLRTISGNEDPKYDTYRKDSWKVIILISVLVDTLKIILHRPTNTLVFLTALYSIRSVIAIILFYVPD